MHLRTRNIETAFHSMARFFAGWQLGGTDFTAIPVRYAGSRLGKVAVIDEPVTITYEKPLERVLMNAARDANPFLHVFEAMWMLAGRDDVGPLANIVPRMAEFSDDGKTLNGAYGRRWRKADWSSCDAGSGTDWHECDQIAVIVEHLKTKPDSRRAVLTMWNVEDDLLKVDTSKDVCCNLSVAFALREDPAHTDRVLDMTVFNRSNDLVWGMLGADFVAFSFLQEYVAAKLGVPVGMYHQVSANCHAYVERDDWKPREWIEWGSEPPKGFAVRVPLVADPERFDLELEGFVQLNQGGTGSTGVPASSWEEPFFQQVAQPMMHVHHWRKSSTAVARGYLEAIRDSYWRDACTRWVARRDPAAKRNAGSGI